MSEPAPSGAKPTLFISYSRADARFVDALADALAARYAVLVDRKDIAAGEPWRPRLEVMIRRADAVLFVISPASARSEVCAWELGRADALAKRLIPVRLADPAAATPEALGAVNWLAAEACAPESGEAEPAYRARVATALAALADAAHTAFHIETLFWTRLHTKWTARAAEWDAAVRADDRLPPPGEVAELKVFLEQRSLLRDVPAIPPTLTAYFEAGAAEAARRADEARARALLIQRAFAEPTRRAVEDGRHDLALRLAAAGFIVSGDDAMALDDDEPEPRRNTLFRAAAPAVAAMRLRAVYPQRRGDVLALTPHGSRMVLLGKPSRDAEPVQFDLLEDLSDLDFGESFEPVRFRGHGAVVARGAHAPAAGLAAFADDGGAVSIWREDGAALTRIAGRGAPLIALRFTADGLLAADAAGASLYKIADAAPPERLWTAEAQALTAIDATPDGARLFASSADGLFRYDRADGYRPRRIADDTVSMLCAAHDGARFLGCDAEGEAALFEAESGRRLLSLAEIEWPASLIAAFSHNGRKLAFAASDWTRLTVADVWTGATLFEIATRGAAIDQLVWSEDDKTLFTVARGSGDVAAWDAACADMRLFIQEDREAALALAVDPDGAALASGSASGALRLHCMETGARLFEHQGAAAVAALGFSADGETVRCLDCAGTLRRLTRSSGALAVEAELGPLRLAATTPTADLFVALDDQDRLLRWPAAETPPSQARFEGAERIAVAPNGAMIAIGAPEDASRSAALICAERFAPLHDLLDGRKRRAAIADPHDPEAKALDRSPLEHLGLFGRLAAVDFSRDGALVLASAANVALWRTETGAERRQLQQIGNARCAVFSQSADLIAVAAFTEDGATRLGVFSIQGDLLMALDGLDMTVSAMAFSADGRALAVGDQFGEIRVFDIARTRAFRGDRRRYLAAAIQGEIGRIADDRGLWIDMLKETRLEVVAALSAGALFDKSFHAQQAILAEPRHEACYRLAPGRDPLRTSAARSDDDAEPEAETRGLFSRLFGRR